MEQNDVIIIIVILVFIYYVYHQITLTDSVEGRYLLVDGNNKGYVQLRKNTNGVLTLTHEKKNENLFLTTKPNGNLAITVKNIVIELTKVSGVGEPLKFKSTLPLIIMTKVQN